ncbi:3'-5' exonuclease [Runella rosea]|uniref:3'-5' exonuclease n=1 Tax=Runella rosea TaxID=2259595 RepID=A0A344TN94_9BACT|nr:3'-5' exonuclease [Runella rosea]AXE20115.1 3'-5' exonuclease [Runella rosea]
MQELRRVAKNILFIDLETVSGKESFDLLDERMQEQWQRKAANIRNDEHVSAFDLFYRRAAIYSEFGKIICIGVGALYWVSSDEQPRFKVKTIAGDDEKAILLEFKELIEKYPQNQLVLCAHNGKEFDFPFLCRRMLVNGITLPDSLKLSGKKPWEILHQDTLDMWRFGDYKSFAQLDLLAALFGIPSSKSDISGEDVTRVYYAEKDLDRIRRYCKEDVVVLAQLWLRLNQYDTIKPELIVRAE